MKHFSNSRGSCSLELRAEVSSGAEAVETPSMFIKVDLPRPLAPTIATNSPSLNFNAYTAQCVYTCFAQFVVLASSTRMSAVTGEAAGVGTGWLTAGVDSMELFQTADP